jgi:hypothetical protein
VSHLPDFKFLMPCECLLRVLGSSQIPCELAKCNCFFCIFSKQQNGNELFAYSPFTRLVGTTGQEFRPGISVLSEGQ